MAGKECKLNFTQVQNDYLDMRVPVWITDIQWLDSTSASKIMTATGYGHVRTYSTSQRKPLSSFNTTKLSGTRNETQNGANYDTHPIKSITLTKNEFIVSDTIGTVSVHDAATGVLKGALRGIAGCVGQVYACAKKPLIVTIGTDRFLRVFEAENKRRLVQTVRVG